jgi:internalin A
MDKRTLTKAIKEASRTGELNLRGKGLTELPLEVCELVNLRSLSLSDNELAALPSEIGRLIELKSLEVSNNRLKSLPPEIRNLTKLSSLDISHNQFEELTHEIGKLTNLVSLEFHHNAIEVLPPWLFEMRQLQRLYIGPNRLTALPPEIGKLTNLKELAFDRNARARIPSQIGHLFNLQVLFLFQNGIDDLSPEIGRLRNLRSLILSDNKLTSLPPEIGQLTSLETLDLARNQITELPRELGNLINLNTLDLNNNPLISPPPEIVAQGTSSVLDYLRALQGDSITRYEAKLLVVGEGGTGKSSLLRALRGEEFDRNLSTTHGIEVARYMLPHPDKSDVKITLNTWDFGGQQIYHATHQFFLTRRSLYVIIWNARLGAEQGRITYWLDTIKALAPDAPVVLVATHIDERSPDLNYPMYQTAYPQLAGNISISNLTGEGLPELKIALAEQAAQLPLMGQPWPNSWLSAERTLSARPDHHLSAGEYINCCESAGIEAETAQGTLGEYLHYLGKILYFRDDYVLSNLVVLKPNWITKAISKVLTDPETSLSRGILTHSRLPEIWEADDDGQPYEPHLYPVFLRLMERFDLSYQIEADIPGGHTTGSLVPQLLPHQPPIDLPPWPDAPPASNAQVEMIYRLDFIPSGIMSWFIVRTHPYTRNLHWREGVLLEYQGHHARAELNPMLRELRIVVWGIQPHNFFTILKNTIDLILARFEGLTIQRDVPCICHWQRGETTRCPRFYPYEDLVRRMEAKRHAVECPDSFCEVSVPTLLYGIHTSTDEQIMAEIKQARHEIGTRLNELQKFDLILEKLSQQSELIVRNFTRQWNLEMQKLEAECPSTFWLMTLGRSRFNPKNWVGQEYKMFLLCQNPPSPHTVSEGYSLRQPEEWWIAVSPWLNHLIKFIKFGVPMGKAVGIVYNEEAMKKMEGNVGLMDEIVKSLPEFTDVRSDSPDAPRNNMAQDQHAVGAALRAIFSFLHKADPQHIWAGLSRTLTPDGNILWLCDTHRQQYEVKPLVLSV